MLNFSTGINKGSSKSLDVYLRRGGEPKHTEDTIIPYLVSRARERGELIGVRYYFLVYGRFLAKYATHCRKYKYFHYQVSVRVTGVVVMYTVYFLLI